MNERMEEQYDYQSLIQKGKLCKLMDMIREDHEALIFSHEFSRDDSLLSELWKKHPSMARMLMTELLEGEDGGEIVKMLEPVSCPFSFYWEGCKCEVNGNILFLLVWNGEYDLVKLLLKLGMEPNGICRSVYIKKDGKHISPYRRWGKMKCREEQEEFFAFDHFGDPWGVMERENESHIITPLYLAELQKDEKMIHILRKAGCYDTPSREKMWEDAKAPKSSGSIFGRM